MQIEFGLDKPGIKEQLQEHGFELGDDFCRRLDTIVKAAQLLYLEDVLVREHYHHICMVVGAEIEAEIAAQIMRRN